MPIECGGDMRAHEAYWMCVAFGRGRRAEIYLCANIKN